MWSRPLRTLAFVLFAPLVGACETAEPSQGELQSGEVCRAVNEQRASCGLGPGSCEGDESECYAECLFGWGCEELQRPEIDPGISACLWNCSPRFTCDDGVEVYAAYRCDGIGDCSELEDERDCPRPSGGDAGGVPGFQHPVDGGMPAVPASMLDGGDYVSHPGSDDGGGLASADAALLENAKDASVDPDGSVPRDGRNRTCPADGGSCHEDRSTAQELAPSTRDTTDNAEGEGARSGPETSSLATDGGGAG